MPFVALYRKKRPKTFEDVIGQPHIVRTLKNQLISGNISHAYLFCGTRGTGKTSTAKIFSRAVNCQDVYNGEPCNECESCVDILNERNLNVAEIDAASNNGVENIRDLREEVKYPPTEGKYRVYIIDEVHMLSTSAFNALLKTLEEPPPFVIFILATTDTQKIPATILSRCQRFDFKRITMDDMVKAIKGYIGESTVEEEAIRYIASLSDGAMRDALSILDQCLSFYGDEAVTLEKAQKLLGAVDRKVLFDFTDALASADINKVLVLIDGIIKEGRDVGQFISDFLRHARDLMVIQSGGLDLLEYTDEVRNTLKEQSRRIGLDTVIRYIYAFSELQRDLRFAPHGRTALEVCAVKLCKPVEPILIPLEPQKITETKAAIPVAVPKDTPIPQIRSVIKTESLGAVVKGWGEFVKETPMPMRSWLSPTGAELDDDALRVICTNEAGLSLIKGRKKEIGERLKTKFNLEAVPNLAFAVRDAYNIPANGEQVTRDATESDDWSAFGDQVEMGPGW
jgi:DNA polymerase-3 subunit gamma/tau